MTPSFVHALQFVPRAAALCAGLLATAANAHPGSLDPNGGHYFGNSYHCHMNGCESPDTFTRRGRDSLLLDRRSRENFLTLTIGLSKKTSTTTVSPLDKKCSS